MLNTYSMPWADGHHGGARRAVVLAGLLLLLTATAVRAETVTLNFKEADLEAVAGTVSELTGKNFIIDPRVKGKVTILSSKPLDEGEVYEVFLSVLQVHGFTAVPSGDVIKIVPDTSAKQLGVPVTGEDQASQGDEMVTRVIEVENVPAAQLVPILRPLVPQQGHMVAYPPSNVLIISDRAGNIQRMADIISRIDKPAVEGEVDVVSLEHASASEIVQVINSLQQEARQRGSNDRPGRPPVIVADERTNSVLVGGSKSDRLRMRALISHLDTPLEEEGDIHVMYLRYANAKDLVPVLEGVGQSVQREQQAQGGQGGAQRAQKEFDIQADEATNALVITAPRDLFKELKDVVRKLDTRRAQVMVEAVIAEVSMNRTAELGVQWAFDGTPDGNGPVGGVNFGSGSGSSIAEIGGAIAGGENPQIGDGLSVGIGKFDSDTLNFAALVRALQGDGSSNVLSTPSILTLDNEEAEIVVGQNVPFVTGSFTSTGQGSATPGNPFQTIQREDVGVTLKVKPQLNEGDSIRLAVEQTVDSIAPSSQGAADLITNTRSIKTSVLVDDGEAVVLGGLITDDLRENTQKVPVLGDIPVLGALFRSKSTTKEKTNLMVFLRPVILKDPQRAAQLTGSKYNFMRNKQQEMRRKGVALLRDQEAPVMPPFEEYVALPPPFDKDEVSDAQRAQ